MDIPVNSSCSNDDTFGPTVEGCRDNFDFTYVFQQTIFSMVPSSLLVLLGISRLAALLRRPVILKGRAFQIAKVSAASAYASLQLAQLILTALRPRRTTTELPAAVLSLSVSILLPILSFYEHGRSLRPSTLLTAYLLSSLLLDAAQSRTRWLLLARTPVPPVAVVIFTTSTAVKAVLVALESWSKESWISANGSARYAEETPSPETTSGILNRGVLFWLNRLVARGYRSTLAVPDLFALDPSLSAEWCQAAFQKRWSAHQQRRHDVGGSRGKEEEPSKSLVRAIAASLWPSLAAPILPRILLGCVTFTQPFYINAVLAYLQSSPSSTTDVTPSSHGYGLIAAAALIYPTMAVFSSLYHQRQQRFLTRLRGLLVPAIYTKTLRLPSTPSSSSSSSSLTLMNADVGRVTDGLHAMHEFWASAIETGLAAWLLQRQLGAAFAAPIVVVFVCTAVTVVLARFSGRRQASWMARQERRVGLVAAVVPDLVAVKMAGLAGQVGDLMQRARVDELEGARRWFILSSATAGIAYAPLLLSPAFAFAVSTRQLDVSRVFTSLAWIHMLSNPLAMILQVVPIFQSALASLKRIEDFLSLEEYEDTRIILKEDTCSDDTAMASIKVAELGWNVGEPVLKDVSLEFHPKSLTVVVGAVASGKTTLANAILGELPLQSGDMTIRESAKTATSYCNQDAYISNGTIRENIVGSGSFHAPWYEEVVQACRLGQDFASLPQGDQGAVGSKGASLSGGQRKRVALARALYSRPKLAVLDDVLSGLDARTESSVAEAVFGSGGLLRKMGTTAVLFSQSGRFVSSLADQAVLLRDGTVAFCGPPSTAAAEEFGFSSTKDEEEGARLDEGDQDPEFLSRPAAVLDSSNSPESNPRKVGGLDEHKLYLSTIGRAILVPWAIIGIIFAFLFNFGNIWLQYWAESNETSDSGRRTPFFLGIYFLLMAVCSLLMAVWAAYGGCIMTPLAGEALHLRALAKLLRAPLAYCSRVDASVLTGYFAQDTNIIDLNLSFGFSNTVLTGLTVLGKAAVIAIASPWVLIAYPVLAGVLFLIQKIYLRTSTQLRFLVLESKDPLYKHFMETTSSLATIRAFDWVPSRALMARTLVDDSQRPAYLLSMLAQWLDTVLSLCVAAVAVVFVALATQLRTSAGFTGVGLVSLMSFAQMIGDVIRNYTELQTAMAALARLRSFEAGAGDESQQTRRTKGAEEAEEADAVVVPALSPVVRMWPARGAVSFRHVSASYGPEGCETSDARVLKNINLDVAPGEKVLICGRTASGKSTLLLLLEGFLSPDGGSVLIDGIPIGTVPPTTLRNRIIALPQLPFFLPGSYTVRENLEFHGTDHGFHIPDVGGQRRPGLLDLFRKKHQYTGFATSAAAAAAAQDPDCEYALRKVGLWTLVSGRGGLDAELAADSLSRGEKQLFSLARAVVRLRRGRGAEATVTPNEGGGGGGNGGVLLLDEVNTGLDAETERAMWSVLGDEFEGYTILCVAHGLGGLEHCDRIVLLDSGELVESGTLQELLGKEGGRFRELWSKAAPQRASSG